MTLMRNKTGLIPIKHHLYNKIKGSLHAMNHKFAIRRLNFLYDTVRNIVHTGDELAVKNQKMLRPQL